jgi:hypothetical protein
LEKFRFKPRFKTKFWQHYGVHLPYDWLISNNPGLTGSPPIVRYLLAAPPTMSTPTKAWPIPKCAHQSTQTTNNTETVKPGNSSMGRKRKPVEDLGKPEKKVTRSSHP